MKYEKPENTARYKEIVKAIEEVLVDVGSLNMDSSAAKEWLAEHICWKLWLLENNKSAFSEALKKTLESELKNPFVL